MKSIRNNLPLLGILFLCLPLTVQANEAPKASQLVLKYDFERADGIANWRQDLGKNSKPDLISLDNSGTKSHSGMSALKFEIARDSDGPRHVYVGAKIPTEEDIAGRTIRVRLFARTENIPANQVTVQILERNATAVMGWMGGKQKFLPIEPSKDWKAYEATGTLSPKTRVVTLFVMIDQPIAGQKVWIDDISLEVVQPAK
jgi:hypothetical protein